MINISGIKSSLPKVNTLAIICGLLDSIVSNVKFKKSLIPLGIEHFSIAFVWDLVSIISSTNWCILLVSEPILFIDSTYSSKWLTGLLFWSISLSSPKTISLINLLETLSFVGYHGVSTQVKFFWRAFASDIKSQTAKTWISINFDIDLISFNLP